MIGHPGTSTFAFILAFSVFATHSRADDCSAATQPGAECKCELSDLRPLQGAIGLAEVKIKADDIRKDPDGEWKHLKKDPIKIVRGPGGKFYVTDHHHGARAWMEAGKSNGEGVCLLQCDLSSLGPDKFWAALKEHRLARLKDKDGKDIQPRDLPTSIGDLPDDPYRSLAYFVREKHGICRSLMKQKEFAEFEWADWFRGKGDPPAAKVEAAPDSFVDTAKNLAAQSPSDRPDGFLSPGAICPKEEKVDMKCPSP